MIHPSINEGCKTAIQVFYDSDKAVVDFIKLKSHGKDLFSNKSIEELEQFIGYEVSSWIKNKLSVGDYGNALRWCARGLNKEDSCKKAEVDAIREIQKVSYIIRKKRHAK